MNKTTQKTTVQKFQKRNAYILGLSLLALLQGISYLFGSHQHAQAHSKTEPEITTMQFSTPLQHVDSQKFWAEQTDNKIKEQTQITTSLTQQIQTLQQSKISQEKIAEQTTQILQTLQSKLDFLSQQLTQQNSARGAGANLQLGNDPAGLSSEFINDDTLTLSPRTTSFALSPLKNPATFVPAGTFVRAIMLGGADASAGVTSQGDPSPTLFRILDQGTLPNHQRSHLKNCVATAAAVGDISSERGAIRLERLSCTRKSGEVVELPVEATVFGPDGKNGVRGRPLWREGALLQRAFAAGALSGISSGIAQSYTTSSLSPLGAVQTVDNGKILQFGLANGAKNAAEKLAEYNIKRAEQYHPVIQLSAGTEVDIVFLKGFFLDGKTHDEKGDRAEREQGQQTTSFASTNYTSTDASWFPAPNTQFSTLPLSSEQIERLKQKNAEQGY